VLEQDQTPGRRISRRRFLQISGGVAGAAAIGAGAYEAVAGSSGGGSSVTLPSEAVRTPGAALRLYSRPDLRPPQVAAAGGGGPGRLFLGLQAQEGSQAGPLVLDERGELLYFTPAPKGQWVTCVRPWRFRGRQALAWWQGQVVSPGFGRGHAVLVDDRYRPLMRIEAARGREMDLHELQLTQQGTALFTCFPALVHADLRAIGGPRDGRVLESVFQEIDLRSGRLLLEWHSLDHISVSESYRPLSDPYDYLHLNSIEVLPDGNLLVSCRHTWALYKLERRTGRVIWRLGGKRSDFELGSGARFSWQHDARHLSPGRISVFDDGSDGQTNTEKRSRGLLLDVDYAARRVSLAHAFVHPNVLTAAMGSVQVLPGGQVLVGWGTQPYTSAYASNGKLLVDYRFPRKQMSYRAYGGSWRARPHEAPALAARRRSNGIGEQQVLYASWNGSTEVAYWRVQVGEDPARLRPLGVARRRGFETAIPMARSAAYAAVAALDAHGRELGRSRPLRL